LLSDFRIQAAKEDVRGGGHSKAKRKLAALEVHKKNIQSGQAEDTFISENDILGPRKKAKSSYEDRVLSIQKGREGREKFGSHKGQQRKGLPGSTTNKEKARNKPIMMILSSGTVRSKKRASLREKQQKLRKHIEKTKRSHH
jgi:protein SDA1